MLKKPVWVAVFLGVFSVISLFSDTVHARPFWRPRRPVMVVPQPVVVQRPVYVRTYRRVYRPMWRW